MAREGADPVVFMEAQFDDAAPIPEPSMLLSGRAVDAFLDHRRSGPRRAAERLRVEESQFLGGLGRARGLYGLGDDAAARSVLLDPGVELSPLFRAGLADEAGAWDLAGRFHDAALAQLAAGFYAYPAGWGDFVPAGLLGEAIELMAAMCGEGGDPR